MKLIDKLIGTISPERALKREAARRRLEILNSGYSHHGASRVKKSMIGWKSAGGAPDEDITDNLETLRERCRDLYMGAPLATGALKTLRTNVIGSGLRLAPAIDYEFLGMTEEAADEWERAVEREFSLWADSLDCDATRMADFGQLQALAFLAQLMSGDCFALLPVVQRPGQIYDLRVYLIESDRIMDPSPKPSGVVIRGGVEIGQYGDPVAYHVAQKHPLSTAGGNQSFVRVEAFGRDTGRRNILHLLDQERPEQRRGVPILAPVIETMKQLTRYSEAELMAAVVSGMFTVFIKSDTPDTPLGEVIASSDQVDATDQNSYELGNGAIIGLNPSESIQEANPSRPNPAFDGFVTAMCRQIGTAIEVPYELLVKHFTASYSASRAALLEAWKSFRMRRQWMARRFCQPIYEEWLAEAIAKGRIEAPGFFEDPAVRLAYSKAEWHGPSQGQIDPEKEVRASKMRVDEGFSTRTRETAELTGGSWEQNHRIRVKEERMRRDGGLTQTEATTDETILVD